MYTTHRTIHFAIQSTDLHRFPIRRMVDEVISRITIVYDCFIQTLGEKRAREFMRNHIALSIEHLQLVQDTTGWDYTRWVNEIVDDILSAFVE